jgi:hypothetical protein
VNPERGEAPFPGTDYTVRFTLGSLCELEAQLGESYSVVARLAAFETGRAQPSARELDALLDHGLRPRHGRLGREERDAAVIAAGGIIPTARALLRAAQAAFGEPDTDAGEATQKKP